MADLPEISQNLDDPLPQVDPNSQLVPYRMSRTDPGGQPVVTTGYGPRGRPPIQPPESFGGGVGMPSLDQVYQSAFSQLPVDEAVKAVEAATRYVAQRGYQKDIQGGADPIKTFAKYAPLMFKQATGLPEVFQAQIQQQRLTAPPTPQQMIQNRLNQARFDAAQNVAKQRQAFDAARQALAERKQNFVESKPVPKKQANITVPLDPSNPDGAKITGPANDPDVMEAVKKHEEASKPKPAEPTKGLLEKAKDLIIGEKPKEPQKITTKEQYDALKSGTVYVGKDGKKYRKP